MCSGIFHTKCGTLGTCVAGPVWFSCENLGTRCLTCSDALMNGERIHGLLVYNEHGEFACLLMIDATKSGIQPFDKLTEVNGIAADEYFEKVYQPDGEGTFELTFYRDGKPQTLTLSHA